MPNDRQNIPKVPACIECNGVKSKYEHYIATVLPFGGRHGQAKENLTTMVPKRISKNRNLLYNLRESFQKRQNQSFPEELGTPIDFDHETLIEWFKYVGFGLMWHEFDHLVPPSYQIDVIALSDFGETKFRLFFNYDGFRIKRTIGADVVRYEAIASKSDIGVGAIMLDLYNEALFIDNATDTGVTASKFGIMVGPADASVPAA